MCWVFYDLGYIIMKKKVFLFLRVFDIIDKVLKI